MMKNQDIRGSWSTHFISRYGYYSHWLVIFKYGMSINLNFFLVLCVLAFIFYNFSMVNPAVSLRFKFKKCHLIKDNNLLYKDRTYSTNKRHHL